MRPPCIFGSKKLYIPVSRAALQSGQLVEEPSNQCVQYLDGTTGYPLATVKYFQQIGARNPGITLPPGQIGKTGQLIGELVQSSDRRHHRGSLDRGILHDHHDRCGTVDFWFSRTWRYRLLHIICHGIVAGHHYFAGKEILKSGHRGAWKERS